jgi:transcriptional regulator with XRE-family HTH domain
MSIPGPKSTSVVDHYVSARIKLRRMELNISQERLGDLVGVKFQQIQKYETARNRVSASRLLEIANALGVTIEYFFQDYVTCLPNNPGKAETKISDFLKTREGVLLNTAVARLPAEQRKSVIDMVKSLAV